MRESQSQLIVRMSPKMTVQQHYSYQQSDTSEVSVVHPKLSEQLSSSNQQTSSVKTQDMSKCNETSSKKGKRPEESAAPKGVACRNIQLNVTTIPSKDGKYTLKS